MIANMLQLDPDLRFSSEDVLDHYWTNLDQGYRLPAWDHDSSIEILPQGNDTETD